MKDQNAKKIIFMGTPDFGLPALKMLVRSGDFEVVAIVTQPDKKVGRKQILTPPSIKEEALKNNIKTFQPDKISNIKNEIENLNPDLIIVIAYGQIIPEEILNIPKYGSINIHGSLLPLYRGAACVQAAILNGDKESGITIMEMEKGLDCGPIIYTEIYKIKKEETSESLYNNLSLLGAKNLVEILNNYISGKIKPMKQKDCDASYITKTCKTDGKIDCEKSAIEIERLVRAMTPWPGAYINKNSKNIKIIKTSTEIKKTNEHKFGSFFVDDKNLFLQCASGAVQILEIQPEGKKRMDAKDFMAGYSSLIDVC